MHLVVVREPVGRQQVPLPDLHAIDPELTSRDVQQPLAHEHTMLGRRAPVRDDRLVG